MPVAIEGLPGAGKTTFIAALAARNAHIVVIPELVLAPPTSPTLEYFVANDLRKWELAVGSDRAIMDRFWASTAAYVLAESRLLGGDEDANTVITSLFHYVPPVPTLCVFLDSDAALDRAFAPDGRFPDPAFRRLLRIAYFDVLAAARVLTWIVHDGEHARALGLLQDRLSSQTGGADGEHDAHLRGLGHDE